MLGIKVRQVHMNSHAAVSNEMDARDISSVLIIASGETVCWMIFEKGLKLFQSRLLLRISDSPIGSEETRGFRKLQ